MQSYNLLFLFILQNKLITVTPDTKVLKAMQLMTGIVDFGSNMHMFVAIADVVINGTISSAACFIKYDGGRTLDLLHCLQFCHCSSNA